MKTSLKFAVLLTVFSLITFVSQTQAQSTTVTASGTVVEPISLSGTGLQFGTEIFPGSDKSVAKTEANASQFDVSGEPGKNVNVVFTLPSEMLADTSSATMPISFSSTDAGHAASSSNQSSQTAFDPSVSQTLSLDGSTGELYVWLGGTISPSTTQKKGAYSADITLDVSYPSN